MSSLLSSRRVRLGAVVGAAVMAVAASTVAALASPGSDLIPVTITNNTGANQPVYLYLLASDTTRQAPDNLGYVDSQGVFRSWPKANSATPVPAPDVSMTGPANGRSVTVKIPSNLSGRLYYSIGKKLSLRLVRTDLGSTGLIQPAPWVADDADHDTLFDWTEFTVTTPRLQDTGIWINSTQVDQFAIPATIAVTGSKGTASTGTLVPGGRRQVIDTVGADPATAKSVVRAADGRVLRVLAPSHASRQRLMDPHHLRPAIDKAWAAYKDRPLTVVPFRDQPGKRFTGRTVGTSLVFTDAAGKIAHAIQKPSSIDVYECAGALEAPNDLVKGPIARTICAALNRGTLGTSDVEPVTDPKKFYVSGGSLYAKTVHQAMRDGRAYAFAFDDVAEQESLVHQSKPTAISITLQPLDGSATPSSAAPQPSSSLGTATPSPTKSPSPSTSPGNQAKTTRTAQVTIGAGHPGYATLVLGEGTGAGQLLIEVAGGSRSKASVNGPGRVRVDLNGPKGTRKVTVTGYGGLGSLRIIMP